MESFTISEMDLDLLIKHFLETFFHCPQCCSLFPAVREQKESFRDSSEYQTLPFRNPA